MRALIVLIMLYILFFHSCGIDEVLVLNPPVNNGSIDIDNLFQFSSTEKNGGAGEEDYFRGFELYYKFYDNRNQVEEYYTSNEDLTNENGFYRMTYYSNENDCDKFSYDILPLIKVPQANRGKGSLFTIDFWNINDEGDVYLKAEERPDGSDGVVITKLPLRRGIEDSENKGFYKTFESFTIGVDKDVTAITGNTVYIVLYVYSFGIYGFEKIYSDLVCLGNIEIKNITLE